MQLNFLSKSLSINKFYKNETWCWMFCKYIYTDLGMILCSLVTLQWINRGLRGRKVLLRFDLKSNNAGVDRSKEVA